MQIQYSIILYVGFVYSFYLPFIDSTRCQKCAKYLKNLYLSSCNWGSYSIMKTRSSGIRDFTMRKQFHAVLISYIERILSPLGSTSHR